jgi:hypothetical protein
LKLGDEKFKSTSSSVKPEQLFVRRGAALFFLPLELVERALTLSSSSDAEEVLCSVLIVTVGSFLGLPQVFRFVFIAPAKEDASSSSVRGIFGWTLTCFFKAAISAFKFLFSSVSRLTASVCLDA